jgi:hypothetical protein
LVLVVPLADESDAAVLESESAAAFLVFFFVVFVLLSALEPLCVSCARTCVVNTNNPISAATASMKNRARRILFIAILRVLRLLSLQIFQSR